MSATSASPPMAALTISSVPLPEHPRARCFFEDVPGTSKSVGTEEGGAAQDSYRDEPHEGLRAGATHSTRNQELARCAGMVDVITTEQDPLVAGVMATEAPGPPASSSSAAAEEEPPALIGKEAT
uniref:Uncharacterized protein n=1 Tax=Oryza barthii TaxID=65489 RepID=A0A0D3HMP0_9ORYZ